MFVLKFKNPVFMSMDIVEQENKLNTLVLSNTTLYKKNSYFFEIFTFPLEK